MQQERETIHKRLDEELEDYKFDKHESIIKHTHPRTWTERLRVFMNRELELPLVPISMVVILGLGLSLYQQLDSSIHNEIDPASRQVIEVGGSIYWEDAYDKVVKQYENNNKN